MISILFLDLGNVLVKVDKSCAFHKISELTGLGIEAIEEAAHSALEADFERGIFSIDEYMDILRENYLLPAGFTSSDLMKIWGSSFKLNYDVWSIIPRLREKARVFLLSNTNPIHFQVVEKKYHLMEQLDGTVLSFEVGYRKPEPEIYFYALEKSGNVPEETFFIDDLEENIVGAEKVGIRGFQFTNFEDLLNFFRLEGFRV